MHAIDYHLLDETVAVIKERWPAAAPRYGVMLGSGWNRAAQAFKIQDSIPYAELPALGSIGVTGHAGLLSWGSAAGTEVLVFQGRRHLYEGVGWSPIAFPVYALKQLGAQCLVLTSSSGGIRSDLEPGDLMIITDHINLMGDNPLIGDHHPLWGDRFPELSNAYAAELIALFERAAEQAGETVKKGVYCACRGPNYETPAEGRLLRTIGADAVGMSTVPSVILAAAAGLQILGVASISNRVNLEQGGPPPSHEEVLAVMQDIEERVEQIFSHLAAALPACGILD